MVADWRWKPSNSSRKRRFHIAQELRGLARTDTQYSAPADDLRAEVDEIAWATLYQTRSRPFSRPESGKIAVKVINHYGDEVLKVYDV